MSPDRFRQIKEIYFQALEHGEHTRSLFLETACQTDPDLRAEVESLLLHDESAGSFLSTPPGLAVLAEVSRIPERIGPYRVLREIDSGGMGAVYLAEREEHFHQKIAIKLIKRGLPESVTLRRFELERQILARLEHPYIARLLDGGTTKDGQPYFVMEYVEGQAITRYCDDRRLSLDTRLALFRRVCAAVSYAHQNLIVHRDLKPSNILVAADGTPKLLDFGLAKIIDPSRELDQTVSAMQIMTPAYASPEQVLGKTITVASDIYALGVILYELLSGRRPYDVGNLSALETARLICDYEPQPPSANFADEAAVPETAARRSSTPSRLFRRLAGDLDNMVMMALRKDPARRYASVEQFSEDIRLFLQKRPIQARRDSVPYRVTRFVERNPLAISAFTVATLALIAGIGVTLWQARRAERRFNDLHRLANSVVFELHDAIEKLPGSTHARALLVSRALQYLDRLAAEAGNDLDLKRDLARAYRKVADVQGQPGEANLGDTASALKNYEKSASLLEALTQASPNDAEIRRELARCYLGFADVLDAAGQVDRSLSLTRNAIDAIRPAVEANPSDRKLAAELASANFSLGMALAQLKPDEALAAYREARQTYEVNARLKPDDLTAQRNFALTLKRTGGILARARRLDEARSDYEKARQIDEKLVDRDPSNVGRKLDLSFDYSDLGWIAGERGDYRAALGFHQKALALRTMAAEADPKNTRASGSVASSLARIGIAQNGLGEFDAARASLEKALSVRLELAALPGAGPVSQTEVSECETEIGDLDAAQKRWQAARERYQTALARYRDLEAKKQLHPNFKENIDELEKRIANCDKHLGGK